MAWRGSDTGVGRAVWVTVGLAVAASAASQLAPLGGRAASLLFFAAALLVSVAAGMLLRGLPAERWVLLSLVASAVALEALAHPSFLPGGEMRVAWSSGHLDVSGLAGLVGLVVAAAVATARRPEPEAAHRSTTPLVLCAAFIIATAAWWTAVATPFGLAVPVSPGWVVLGIGGAVLTRGPRAALRHVAVFALLLHPLELLVAPFAGAFSEVAALLTVWAPAAALVVLLQLLDRRAQVWAGAPREV